MPACPLLITTDETLLDQVVTVAAAAGIETMVAPDVVSALPSWSAASVVLVGVDQAAGLLHRRPRPARPIHLLGDEHDRDELCSLSARVGAAVVVLPEHRAVLGGLVQIGAGADREGRMVAVRGASGGAGASTVAAGLAWRAARTGRRCAVVDLDPYGGGLDLVLGAESEPGWRWPDLAAVTGQLVDIAERLPQVDEVTVVSAGRHGAVTVPSATAVDSVLNGCLREHDLVITDLGRSLPDELAAEALARADTALLLVRDDVRGVAAAGALVRAAADTGAAWQVVVSRGPGQGLPSDTIADTLGIEVAATLPHDRALHIALQRGEPPGQVGGRRWRRQLDLLLTLVAT